MDLLQGCWIWGWEESLDHQLFSTTRHGQYHGALVWLNLTLSYVSILAFQFIDPVQAQMGIRVITLRKTLLLYFIFKVQDVRKTVRVAQ